MSGRKSKRSTFGADFLSCPLNPIASKRLQIPIRRTMKSSVEIVYRNPTLTHGAITPDVSPGIHAFNKACINRTIAKARNDDRIFIAVHDFKVSATLMPKYWFTSQKPESLTCENPEPPQHSARTIRSGRYPGIPFTIGATIPAAVIIATVADPWARRIAAATIKTTTSGEIDDVASIFPMYAPTPVST